MPLRSCRNPLLLLTLTLSWSAAASAAPIDPGSPQIYLSVHGTRAINGNGSRGVGWGAGGAVRVAREGSSFVTTVMPWTFGVEIGPRTPRRIEPLFRLGLGMYWLGRRGEYVDFLTQTPTQYSDSGIFSGLDFSGGGYARVAGPAVLELSVTFHQSFSSDHSGPDGPSLGEVQLTNVRMGLGYPLR